MLHGSPDVVVLGTSRTGAEVFVEHKHSQRVCSSTALARCSLGTQPCSVPVLQLLARWQQEMIAPRTWQAEVVQVFLEVYFNPSFPY